VENIKALKRNENQEKFVALRKEWSVFTYERFEVKTDNGGLEATFYFNIDQKHFFAPHIAIPERPFLDWTKIERKALETIVFHIGMIELISYWKTLCPAKVVIKPFALSEPQMRWWKKLYYNGLGEFFYLNGITVGEEEFMQMESDSERGFSPISLPLDEKTLVPIGGGKDSVVTLELLRKEMPVTPLIVNPRGATIGCIEAAGFTLDDCLVINRTLDANMLKLNAEGCLNGHTPFSAMLAFVTLLAAAGSGSRYIALSNESSANESTVPGTKINHQYSKSVEFERDFRTYVETYVNDKVQYFSFLRPLSELQIAMLFSRCKNYHAVFRSCNAGSKTDSWCCRCPKCLFTWIILSPFLSHDELVRIFGSDMSNDKDLLPVFEELNGTAPVKPFECVGTVGEVRTCVDVMNDREGTIFESSPHPDVALSELLKNFNKENFLPERFVGVLKSALYK